MDNKFLKPAAGPDRKPLLVRDPVTRDVLPVEGAWREMTDFYVRRLRDGDVVDATPPVKSIKPPTRPPAASAK